MNLAADRIPHVAQLECHDPLVAAHVQVWKCWLGEDLDVEPLCALLSPDELERAARFVFTRDRRRFIAARAALRSILGERLGEAPSRLRFDYGPQGKPALASAWQESGIQFNLAHSGDWALVALACNKRVGVDLEQIRPLVEGREIARRHFSPRETADLWSLPLELQEEAFFRCWTRKEAYLKALGCGLSLALDAFDVSLLPGDAPALLAARDDPHAPARWRMADLRPTPGSFGAVVVEVA
jgi:4'-phosphopantetheinyl transferase